MNFSEIYAHLFVGSHPSDAADISNLYDHKLVRAIVNLQQIGERDKGDMDKITGQCALVGDRIWYQRVPIEDGKEKPLQKNLPEAVGILNRAITEKAPKDGEMVYLHCCKGLARSPSVAVAYLYWFADMALGRARDLVIANRSVSVPHGELVAPNVPSIIGATNDILQENVIGDITAVQRGLIQQYVTTLRRVTNA